MLDSISAAPVAAARVFTPDQELAIGCAVDLVNGPSSKTVQALTGPAGSGKTTLVREAVSRLEYEGCHVIDVSSLSEASYREELVSGDPIYEHRLLIIAPTNRAARQLRKTTGLPASTIHRAIFQSRQTLTPAGQNIQGKLLPDLAARAAALAAAGDTTGLGTASRDGARLRRALRRETRYAREQRDLGGLATAVIVDEAGMLGARLLDAVRDAVGRAVPVLLIGDPHQLPPVNDGETLSVVPCFAALATVHRHCGPILDFCEHLRAGGRPDQWTVREGDRNQGLVVRPRPRPIETQRILAHTDVVIAGTHDWRRRFNIDARRVLWGADTIKDPTPRVGDRLVIRSNKPEINLFNGDIVLVLDVQRVAGSLIATLQPLDETNAPEDAPVVGVELDGDAGFADYLGDLSASPGTPSAKLLTVVLPIA